MTHHAGEELQRTPKGVQQMHRQNKPQNQIVKYCLYGSRCEANLLGGFTAL